MNALRILHVDDEPDIREVAEMALCLDPAITVCGVASGKDALETAATWSPDLILLDVMMPVMDGPATLVHLRQSADTSAIPVVFMTARAQPRELEHFVSLGAEGVIAKPFDPMTLASSVRNYTGGSQINIGQRRLNFLARSRASAQSLHRHRDKLREPAAAAEALKRIRAIAHSVAGGGGVFGFDRMSADATALENAAIDRIEGRAADVEAAIATLVACIERA